MSRQQAQEFIAYERTWKGKTSIVVRPAEQSAPHGHSTCQRAATAAEIREYKQQEKQRDRERVLRQKFEARRDYIDARAVRDILEWMSIESNPLDALTPDEWHALREKLERVKESTTAEFMREFVDATTLNPFAQFERVWNLKAAFELGVRGDAIHLGCIRSLARGQGNGSAALDWLCELADKHHVAIRGSIQPTGTTRSRLNARQLAAWYKRHGFVVRAREVERQPKHISETVSK